MPKIVVHRRLVLAARARRRGSSGTATCPRSARRRRCSAWTARGRRPGAGAAGPSSGRWRSTRRRCARRRAGRSSRRRSRRRSARRSPPRGRPRRCRTSPRRRRLAERVGELVEEQPPQRSLVARVAREQRALDRLGQVDEREDGLVEVREVRLEAGALGGAEGLDGVLHGGRKASARVGGGVCGRRALARRVAVGAGPA